MNNSIDKLGNMYNQTTRWGVYSIGGTSNYDSSNGYGRWTYRDDIGHSEGRKKE